MRFGLYYSGGFDWTFNDRPIGSMADVLEAVPRRRYPDYADAQVRELIRRYRPSVLWNDVVWPGTPSRLWPLMTYYYEHVPDGVVNDRWLPWSPVVAAAARTTPVRRAIDAVSRRQARRNGGLVPPKPPHYDVRTPEYAAFPQIEQQAWECVRGMDKSFGYNAGSRPDDYIAHDDLLWLLVDTVAKGGNLLLNVGPRGVDAQLPDEHAARLDWLAQWLPVHRDAIAASRPWIRPGTSTVEGRAVRYTARGDTLYVFVQGATGRTTLPDVATTSTTTVASLTGEAVSWRAGPDGLVLEPPAREPGAEPLVVALHAVNARPS
jgi:alpha-L-fucosidase